MNKLLQKVAKLTLGLAMAAGVGVAIGSNSKEVTSVSAAGDELAFHFTGSSVHGSNTSYDARQADCSTGTSSKVSSAHWQITVGNNSAQLGTNAKSGNLSKTTLGNGSFTAASGLASALSITTTTQKYSAAICTTAMANIKRMDLIYTGTNGGNPTQIWVLSSTNGTTWEIEATKSSSISTGASLTFTKNSDARQYAFVASWTSLTNSGGFKGFELKLYGEYNLTQTLSTTPASGEAYTDETITVSSNATNTVTWSIVNDSDTTATGASVTSGGVVSVTGAGYVKVKAVASGYDDATKKIHFTERPTGTYYTVTDSLTNASLSSTADVEEDAALNLTITAAEHYTLPASITVTMGGNSFSSYTYTRNSGNRTASFSIAAGIIEGNLVISGSAVEDAKYTVTYVHGDHGTGDNYVVNNVYGGSYTLATFATAGFTASSGYSFKKWSVGGVEYAEGASVTISAATTVTAIYKSVEEYTLFTGALVEGDYVICSGTKAMKNVTTAAPRIDVADVTVTNNKIVDPDASIVWHIAQDGDYWTIYNAAVEKYAAFTSTNGRGDLIDSVTDYARFTTSDSYEFINVAKSDKYLRYNATYGFGSYATQTGVTLTLYKAPSNELSSIALSGDYKTSFASGETFSFGGTVTASYTIDSPKAVTGSTTFHLDSASGTSMSGVTMTHAAHDGHTIYAKYTEGGITKTATYEISVSNAPVSSVSITTHAAEIGLEEDYSISGITATVLPADAVQTTEWVVGSNTVGDDYTWNGTKLTSGQTEGSVTLRCRSTADNSKYDELVVTISGDPTASFAKDSTSGYAGKSETVSFTFGNFDAEDIAIASGNTSYVTIGTISASEGSGTVVINFVAAGTTSVTIGDGSSTLDTLTVTVSADSVTAVTWSASNIDVFSGETLSTDGWNVQYEMASGDSGSASSYTIKLGSATVTSGYEFQVTDSGKTMHVEYGGESSSSITVTVTQSIHNVYAETYTENTWSHSISATTWTDAYGEKTLNGKAWTAACDAGAYWGYDGTKGQQFGKGADPCTSLTLSSSAFSGTVTTVKVTTSGASSVAASIGVSVGGTALKSGGSESVSISATSTEYTFTGSGSGTITITWTQTSSKALYLKALSVTTLSSSGQQQQIANNASHKEAQRLAVLYAQTFNEFMDDTENCTTGLDAAWASCSTAYTLFKSSAESLGETEEAWAKNLVKYATAQYSDDSAEACLERMMKTYEICVQKHGKTAFMDDLVTLGAPQVSPLVNIIGENTNTVAIIVIISMVSVTAIGGYFFLRKRKED